MTLVADTQSSQNVATYDESDVESVGTATSYAQSQTGDSSLRPPSRPSTAVDELPFECSICFHIVNAPNERLWRQHVYEDLPPYVCMYEDCKAATRQFSRRREWRNHMQEHFRHWVCPYSCSITFETSAEHQEHLRSVHAEQLNDATMMSLSESCARNDQTPSLQCPFCDQEKPTHNAWFKHVGHHLEQLALFALPKHLLSHDSDDEDDEHLSDSDVEHVPDIVVDSDEENGEPNILPETNVEALESVLEAFETVARVSPEYKDEKRLNSDDTQTLAGMDAEEASKSAQPQVAAQSLDTDQSLSALQAWLAKQSSTDDKRPKRTSEGSTVSASQDDADNWVSDGESSGSQPVTKTPRNVSPVDMQRQAGTKSSHIFSRFASIEGPNQISPSMASSLGGAALLPLHPTGSDQFKDTRQRRAQFGFPLGERRLHRHLFSPETLRYYDIPWKTDPHDPQYIIVFREINETDMDVLFEYNRMLREGRTLVASKEQANEEASSGKSLSSNEKTPEYKATAASSLDQYRSEREKIDSDPELRPAIREEVLEGVHNEERSEELKTRPILNDALSYLDHVKVKFADRPEVYNRFLNIMSEFKSGKLDTPGVMGAVNILFAGNPRLIQGFDTFLPPGNSMDNIKDNEVTGTTSSETKAVDYGPAHSEQQPPTYGELTNGSGNGEGSLVAGALEELRKATPPAQQASTFKQMERTEWPFHSQSGTKNEAMPQKSDAPSDDPTDEHQMPAKDDAITRQVMQTLLSKNQHQLNKESDKLKQHEARYASEAPPSGYAFSETRGTLPNLSDLVPKPTYPKSFSQYDSEQDDVSDEAWAKAFEATETQYEPASTKIPPSSTNEPHDTKTAAYVDFLDEMEQQHETDSRVTDDIRDGRDPKYKFGHAPLSAALEQYIRDCDIYGISSVSKLAQLELQRSQLGETPREPRDIVDQETTFAAVERIRRNVIEARDGLPSTANSHRDPFRFLDDNDQPQAPDPTTSGDQPESSETHPTTPLPRPFACDHCPETFNRNQDLKRHQRIHIVVRAYPCEGCDESFSRKDALKRHMLVKDCGPSKIGPTEVGS